MLRNEQKLNDKNQVSEHVEQKISSEQENLEVTFEFNQLHQASLVETNSGANGKQTVTSKLIEMQ